MVRHVAYHDVESRRIHTDTRTSFIFSEVLRYFDACRYSFTRGEEVITNPALPRPIPTQDKTHPQTSKSDALQKFDA